MRTIIITLTILLTGCAVGPKFRSPKVVIPDVYQYSTDSLSAQNLDRWWENFNDSTLCSLIDTALTRNRNLRSVVLNIEVARLGIASARSAALPSIGLSVSGGAKYSPQTKIAQSYSIMPTLSWDIDLWGKIRREVEAAGASFRATEFQTIAIRQTLISEVATTYFAALSYKTALEISQNTYLSRKRSNRLMDSMYHYGWISKVDLAQSQASMATAGASVEQYRRALEQATLSLNLLLGENPHTVELDSLPNVLIVIPSGLPSSLLERRADVMQAYFQVQKANAMIGVAVANRLPSLSITGQGGLAYSIINGVSTGRPAAWSGAAALIAPLLNWGTLRRAEKIARIQTEQAVLGYEQAVLTAINDVEQSLVAVNTYGREVDQCREMVASSQRASTLTAELYRSGSASYLDVLDADRTLFAAQLQYIETMDNQIASYITLYKALGGGW